MDTYPVTATTAGRFRKTDGKTLERAYKLHLSDYEQWNQKEHAVDWMLLEENTGERLSIGETMLCKDLYTFLSNKDGHGKQGSLVAAVKGTTADNVVKRLLSIPQEKREGTKEITLDFSDSMFAIAGQAFPKAEKVIDCFHVMMQPGDGLEEMRLKLKRTALSAAKEAARGHKKRLAMNAARRARYRLDHPQDIRRKEARQEAGEQQQGIRA